MNLSKNLIKKITLKRFCSAALKLSASILLSLYLFTGSAILPMQAIAQTVHSCGGSCDSCRSYEYDTTCPVSQVAEIWETEHSISTYDGQPTCTIYSCKRCSSGQVYVGNGQCADSCPEGMIYDDTALRCVKKNPECAYTESPISIYDGSKKLEETDYKHPRGLSFSRHYYYVPNPKGKTFFNYNELWKFDFHTRLKTSSHYNSTGDTSKKDVTRVQLHIRQGKTYNFSLDNATGIVSSADLTRDVNLTAVTDNINGPSEFTFTFHSGRKMLFDGSGNLTKIVNPNGYTITIENTYVEGVLTQKVVSNAYGEALTFSYTDDLHFTMTTPGGEVYSYDFDVPTANNNQPALTVTFPQSSIVEYVHINAKHDPYGYSIIKDGALTTIKYDGLPFLSYEYDSGGRAISSSKGSNGAEGRTLSYDFSGNGSTTTLTDSLGKVTNYYFDYNTSGYPVVDRVEGIGTINCAQTDSFNGYDSNGFRKTMTDNKGYVTETLRNSRGLVEQERRGLSWSAGIDSTLVDNPESQKTVTVWHATLSLPLEKHHFGHNASTGVYEPQFSEIFTYHPNNRLQSVTQTDTTNHTTPLGNTQGRQKVWTYSYTYHTVAGVAADLLVDTQTIDGPLPGNADVTLRQYDTAGNLIKATNALGHVTTFGNFNGRGQAQTVTDANGIVTQLSYHPRGWLTKVTVKSPDGNALNDHITQYDYYPNGTLQRVTQADGSYLAYDYNDARHLTAISNNLGESITYTLNAEGQWTLAQTKDSSGVIKRQQQRAFDELGRLMDRFGQHNQHTQYNYDKNDNLALVSEQGQTTTPQTSQTYDALNRLKTLVDPDLNTVTYDYDGQGNLSSVTDQRGLQTQYLYDGFQQRIKQTSPDTGVTYFWYDEAGNLSQKQDARGVTTTYTYDLLNRLSGENYPATPGENTTYTYDQTAQGEQGIGRLTHIADPSGSTHYHYNHLGQIVKVDTQVMGAGYLTQYHYQATGQATGITYPSGLHISYQRDALGRIQQIDADESGQLTALASNIQYYPFGPSSQITYGNGLVQTSTYDSDYRLNQSQLSAGLTSFQNLGLFYDWFNNLIGLNDADGLQRQQSFSYDLQHRLDTATDNLPLPQGGYGSQDFAYDPVSNRTLLTTGSDQTTYNYPLDSNRLESSSLWNYEYDAAGNTPRRYDANGNQLVLTYNPRNRLSQVSHTDAGQTHTVTYEYNGLGQRVVKQSNSQTTYYLYDLGGQLLVEADTQGATQKEYVYFENKPLAILDAGETGNTAGFTLMLSPNPDRSAATALAASELSGNAYIFLTPETNISQVRFYLDSTDATGTPLQTENNAPYDLQGGSASAANPFDTTALSGGTHTLFASITLADNSIVTVQANFSVNNASSTPALSLSQSSTSFSLQEGGAAQSQTLSLNTNNATNPAFTVSENAPWLSVQALSPTTPSDIQLTVDPSAVNLAPGTYSETLTATASGYTSAQHTVTLTVTSAGAYTLMLSPNPDRSAATALAASELSGNAYIFLTPDTNISQVRFYLDSTDATGTPLQTENNAPYDLQGGSASAANPFDTTALSDGAHTLFASITLADNSIVTVQVNFTVNNGLALNSPIYHHLAPQETPPDKPLLTAHRVARLNRSTQPSTASL